MVDIDSSIEHCIISLQPEILKTIVHIESSFNPYAIGIVNGKLSSQPKSKEQAINITNYLLSKNINFSVGLGQINIHNIKRLNLSVSELFDVCNNLSAIEKVYNDCYLRALKKYKDPIARDMAFSCYFSGDFQRGFEIKDKNGYSYVYKANLRYNSYKKRN
ncbi:lytic transglycosylase domain-containing protein [Escherichia albertii]|uniref:lytic transglycosylase domain-containing protein n=1 Tax=Escherichia albertii TaxID=208962 RepID=UPI000CF72D06|nr:lytic transglycosylase domain-containing protein [Escherichia albertii]EFB5188741.1 lytic transglycosylase domain-containing protein [Escherichia albertii]EJQ6145863.1 lytic transglycosylase domain-containing protein [Escherichia albertii]